MNKIIKFLQNKYFKFSLALLIYVLWVIWVGNYWLLFGAAIIFDIYISGKVNWTPWKKRVGKNNTLIEWFDALLFAIVAVGMINIFLFQNYKIPTPSMERTLRVGDHLFVSKVSYGPRIPNTPLSFPFAQHTMPVINTKSYLEWIKWPYKRLAGLRKIERNDLVVFNFPEGDTVILQSQQNSYYSFIRADAFRQKLLDLREKKALLSDQEYYAMARERVWRYYDIVVRPVDRCDNYIKRCVAIPGDTLEIIDRQVIINGIPQIHYPGIQYKYYVRTNQRFSKKSLERVGIEESDINLTEDGYIMELTSDKADKLKEFSNVSDIGVFNDINKIPEISIFPCNKEYQWTEDNFGPLYLPKKGDTIELNIHNLPLYKRIIEAYESNSLEVKGTEIIINGKPTSTYTIKMNYYFMMGDNRHSSYDSRFWGFVPEDHIVGSPVFIWLSLSNNDNFMKKIRWDRMFTLVSR